MSAQDLLDLRTSVYHPEVHTNVKPHKCAIIYTDPKTELKKFLLRCDSLVEAFEYISIYEMDDPKKYKNNLAIIYVNDESDDVLKMKLKQNKPESIDSFDEENWFEV